MFQKDNYVIVDVGERLNTLVILQEDIVALRAQIVVLQIERKTVMG